jgi:hypothetical protein
MSLVAIVKQFYLKAQILDGKDFNRSWQNSPFIVQVVTVRPSLFLEAAVSSNDSQLLAAVLRFFSDFTPGFKNTTDCHGYCRILKEMNSDVAVWMSTRYPLVTLERQNKNLSLDNDQKYFNILPFLFTIPGPPLTVCLFLFWIFVMSNKVLVLSSLHLDSLAAFKFG